MDLAGRTALVTGGAHRVGRALALALAAAGCHIVLHYSRSAEAAQRTAAEIAALGAEVLPYQADFARLEPLEGMMAAAAARFGPVSVLINNAAIYPKDSLHDLTADGWSESVRVNLRTPVFLTQAFARRLPAGESGAVVNITDWRTQRPYLTHFSYTVAKAGLDAFTLAAALQLAPHIRVNGIALGAMLAPIDKDAAYLERLAAQLPLQRAGGVDVIADTMLYLLRNDFITGETIRLDGGAHLK